MNHNLAFIRKALVTNLCLTTVLRLPFLIDVVIAIVKHALFLVSWNFFFDKYQQINGWNFNDLLLVYGIVSIGIGIVEIFFYGVKEIPKLVEEGQLDSFLLQPKNLLLNISMSKGRISSIGDLSTGITLIAYSGYFKTALLKVFCIVPISIVMVFSFFLYLSSISFFIKNANGLIQELYRTVMMVAMQPNSAYKGIFNLIIRTILPVAFLSFFPIEFVKNNHYSYLLLSYSFSIVFLLMCARIFALGIQRYESGNLLATRK